MNHNTIKNPETIDCNVCLAEIPESVAANAEADEYVSSYCGLDCYQQWRDRQGKKQTMQDKNGDTS